MSKRGPNKKNEVGTRSEKSDTDYVIEIPFLNNAGLPSITNSNHPSLTPTATRKRDDESLNRAAEDILNQSKVALKDAQEAVEAARAAEKRAAESATRMDSETKKVDSTIEETKKLLKETNRKLEKAELSYAQMLAIFVGLFTFVSIEFQLFRNAEWFMVVPLSLIFLGGIGLFISMLFAVLNYAKQATLIVVVSLIIAVMGTAIYFWFLNKNEYRRLDGAFSGICEELKERLSDNVINKSDEIEKNKRAFETLLCEEQLK